MAALFLALLSSNAEACFLGQCFKRLFGGNDEQDTVVIVVPPRARQAPAPQQRDPGPELQLAVRPPAAPQWGQAEIERLFDMAYPAAAGNRQLFNAWSRTIGSATGTRNERLTYTFEMDEVELHANFSGQTGKLSVLITAPEMESNDFQEMAATWGYPGTETIGGLWLRNYSAMGGRDGVSSVEINFDTDNAFDLASFGRLIGRNFSMTDVDETPSGFWINTLYGLHATSWTALRRDNFYKFVFSGNEQAENDLAIALPRQDGPRRLNLEPDPPQNINRIGPAPSPRERIDADENDEKQEFLPDDHSTHL
jgi:hypothetical protein